MPILDVLLVPPGQQLRIALPLAFDLPVELRRQIIEPAFLLPFAGIGVQRAVLIEADDSRRIARAARCRTG